MTRITVIAFLVWSIVFGAACYGFGVYVQSNASTAELVKDQKKDTQLTKAKNRKALAAGIRAEQAQVKTDTYFQHLRSDYETDQHNNPGIGCVLDPVSLRRWNDANAQSGSPAAGQPDHGLPQPTATEAGPERSEQPY
jgi:hypothetical protein